MAKEIKTISISAKCSDLFSACLLDDEGKVVKEYEGYVPDFFPEEHYGDYVQLDIDIKTGTITNWKVPTKKQLDSL